MSEATAQALPGELVHIETNTATEPFWKAAQQHQLVAPRCQSCATFRLPPTPFCPSCQSTSVDWVELSGTAIVFSYSVVHGFPGLPEVTLVPAVVDLPDAPGARLVSNIIDVDPDDVHIGMRLEVTFSPIADGWILPVFRAATGTAG